jgi:benzoate-CoA ligase
MSEGFGSPVYPGWINVAEVLVDDNVVKGFGDRVAYYQLDLGGNLISNITYSQLKNLTNKFASSLISMGLREGEVVLNIMPDIIENIVAFLGTLKMGGISALINFKLTVDDYVKASRLVRARMIVTDCDHLNMALKVKDEVDSVWKIIVTQLPGKACQGISGNDVLTFDDFLKQGTTNFNSARTHKDDFAFFLFSSGTTGEPKAVLHKHADILYIADTLGKYVLKITDKDLIFSTSKTFFAYGFGYIVAFPLRFGASVLLYPDLIRPELALNVISRYKPTVFASSPVFYRAMALVPNTKEYDLSSIRLASSAGEILTKSVYDLFYEKFGIKIMNCYGSTETLHCFITTQPGRKPGSAGLPVPGYELKIVDPETGVEIKEPNKPGVLWVRGYSVAWMYYRNFEKSVESFCSGWFNTGDIVYRDEDGDFWYVSRADDMIKQGGLWISPYEVENALMQHPAVAEAAVAGYRDEDGLFHAKAFIVLKPGYEPSDKLRDEIREFLREKLAHYKVPHYIEFVKELPKTTTGKILRRLLRNY